MRRLLTLALLVVLTSFAAMAQQMSRLEALYLFNFAKNTSWVGTDGDTSLNIAVVGDKAVAKDLRTIAKNKRVGSRPVAILESASAQGLSGVDVIFLGGAKAAQIETLVSEQAGNKVLIVSATEGHCARGADIAFELVGGKFSYAISKGNIESHGLSVTKMLLNNGRAL